MIEAWQVDLSFPPRDDAPLRALLSPEENAQANRYHFEDDRQRFVRRRAFRRLWLGERLNAPPASLSFVAGTHGKPAVADAPEGFRFNCSASGNRAMLACSTSGEVGADLEHHRPLQTDLALLVKRFAPSEQKVLEALEVPALSERFYECWARKEAFVKAVGCGLSLPLDEFQVPLDRVVTMARAHWERDPVASRRWWVTSLEVGPEWSAAVVTDLPVPIRLHSWAWPD